MTHSFATVNGANKYKAAAASEPTQPWHCILGPDRIDQLSDSSTSLITKIVMVIEGAQRTIDTNADTVIANGVTHGPGSNIDTVYDTILPFFKRANTGYGGSGAVQNRTAYKQVTSTYPTTDNDYTIEAISGTFTITAVTPVGKAGQEQQFVNNGVGVITVVSASGSISGQPSVILNPGHGVIIKSNGTNYVIISIY